MHLVCHLSIASKTLAELLLLLVLVKWLLGRQILSLLGIKLPLLLLLLEHLLVLTSLLGRPYDVIEGLSNFLGGLLMRIVLLLLIMRLKLTLIKVSHTVCSYWRLGNLTSEHRLSAIKILRKILRRQTEIGWLLRLGKLMWKGQRVLVHLLLSPLSFGSCY